jgi:hypothetical protein
VRNSFAKLDLAASDDDHRRVLAEPWTCAVGNGQPVGSAGGASAGERQH